STIRAHKSVIEAMTTAAGPTNLTGGATEHERMRQHVRSDYGTGSDEGELPDGVARDDGCVCADSCAPVDFSSQQMFISIAKT
ncbi:MAG TPA: hypothetical protein PKD47_06000, partial [Solirubrobacterales bacterium]|nr:hypothetical protein [Solirubrobacterales bacterium]